MVKVSKTKEFLVDPKDRAELADLVAQAVIDRLEERRQVNMLVDMVIRRMAILQQEQTGSEGADNSSSNRVPTNPGQEEV